MTNKLSGIFSLLSRQLEKQFLTIFEESVGKQKNNVKVLFESNEENDLLAFICEHSSSLDKNSCLCQTLIILPVGLKDQILRNQTKCLIELVFLENLEQLLKLFEILVAHEKCLEKIAILYPNCLPSRGNKREHTYRNTILSLVKQARNFSCEIFIIEQEEILGPGNKNFLARFNTSEFLD